MRISNPTLSWVLVDKGNPFLETQCLSLVEALEFPTHLHRVSLPLLWRGLPLWLIPDLLAKIQSSPKSLKEPLPSFVICGGRVALKLGAFLRKKHQIFTVAVGEASSSFHKVIVEGHTQDEKGNEIRTLGPLHRIRPEVILQARQTFYRKVDSLPKPRVGIFLEGGERLESLMEMLTILRQKTPFSLMIHGENLSEANKKHLTVFLEGIPHLLWYGQEEDPYLGFLAHSEAIIVTTSSSLMLAETTSAEKPLFIYPSGPLNAYVETLIEKKYAHLLKKESILFSRSILPPLQETQRVAYMLTKAYQETFAGSS